MEKQECNILLSSAGRRSYLVDYFKRALNGSGKVFASNSSVISSALHAADEGFVTPLIYDKEYIPFLIELCKEKNISVIIPLFDIDLPVLAKHKEKFEAIGTKVIVSDSSVIEICNDKWKTYNFLKENRIDTPKTYLKIEDAINAIEKGETEYPVIVKPRFGMGSIAIFEADNEYELRLFYEKTKRNIEATYLKYESINNLDEAVLIQEKICGQEYGLDIINDLQGNYQNTSVKMKYGMRSGETDCAVVVGDNKLKELGKKLSRTMHHVANLDVDVFVTDEKIYVLEMNARFGGGFPFSYLAGVDLPKAIVMWVRGENPDKCLLDERVGTIGQKDINIIELDSVM